MGGADCVVGHNVHVEAVGIYLAGSARYRAELRRIR
jgi:hypothetical protein